MFFSILPDFAPDKDFRRRADHVEVTEVVVIHVGRRIQRPKRAVERNRCVREAAGNSLPDLHLHHFAVRDIVLRLFNSLQIVGLMEVTPFSLARTRAGIEIFGRRVQAASQFTQPVHAFLESFRLIRIRVDDEIDAARDVIHHRYFLCLQEKNIGDPEIVLLRLRELFLDQTDRVIA